MPKNKKPNRKPGVKKIRKRTGADDSQNDQTDPNVKGAKSAAKTYGSPKSSRSAMSPGMTRGSARSR